MRCRGVEGLAAECLIGQWSDVDFDRLERAGGADWGFLFAGVDATEGGLRAGLGRLALENDGDLFAVGAGVEGWSGKGAGGQEGDEGEGGMRLDVFVWLLEEGSRRRIVSRK